MPPIPPPRAVLLALALLLPACAARQAPDRYAFAEEGIGSGGLGGGGGGYIVGGYGAGAVMSEAAPEAYDMAPAPAARSAAPMAKSMPAPSMAPAPPPPPPGTPGPTTGADAADPAEARMVRYDGYARLRVGGLEQVSDQLVTMTKAVGGRVETLSRTRLVLRVPVATFRAQFDAMLGLGEVMEKNISAQDVTDAFASIELRLKSAKATQERLQALLAKSRDEQEKLMLLRELQRIGEEIDAMEAQSRTLVDLASMSRITIELVPREALVSSGPVQESSAFAWIRQLSPFRDEVLSYGKHLPLPVPTGMVALDVKKRFLAESADGARFRAARLENDPEGNATFWLDALETRLAPEFARADRADVGAWKTLRLEDRSDTPYVYVLGVRTDGTTLEIVEIYYPTKAHEARYGDAVRAALTGGGAA